MLTPPVNLSRTPEQDEFVRRMPNLAGADWMLRDGSIRRLFVTRAEWERGEVKPKGKKLNTRKLSKVFPKKEGE